MTEHHGLSEQEAVHRLKTYGLNLLRSRSVNTAFRILARQLHNPLIYILLFSTLLAM